MEYRKELDAIFVKIFEDNPNKEFTSTSIGNILNVSRTTGGNHKNWLWLAWMEDLTTQNILAKRVEYNLKGRVQRNFYKLSNPNLSKEEENKSKTKRTQSKCV